ncbi:MAG: hypothetical protein QOF04_1798 [Solirubrobacteraceae bacterium]|nr:hypothetical protein [Solirubrobacteraceae bacterium]
MAASRARTLGVVALLGALAWALAGRGLVNYDTLYALVWGRDLAHGTLPDYDVSLAPTPHPLATLVGVVLAPLSATADRGVHGEAATTIVLVGAFAALGALGWVVYRLGAEWFNPAAGALAAAIVLTRRPVLDFGARAYVDIPYLVLVLGALLVETRRPRAGAPVLALLALAGLLRPEAWLFSAVYLAWLWRAPRSRRASLLVLAAAGPLLWTLADLLVTGDPLHSLLGTRGTAQDLGRITGLDEVPLTAPRRLGEILREPVLFGAAGGGLLALAYLRERARLAAAAGVVAFAAFCVLATAGLPILGRYLLLPAVILAIFCGAAVFGWMELARAHPRRRPWAWFAAATVVLLVAFTPAQAGRIAALQRALARQDAIQHDLAALAREPRPAIRPACAPVTVPNHRPVPALALWLDLPPRRIVDAQEQRPARGTWVTPATPAVANDYVLDPRDRDRRIVPPPPGFRAAGVNGSWRVFTRCG